MKNFDIFRKTSSFCLDLHNLFYTKSYNGSVILISVYSTGLGGGGNGYVSIALIVIAAATPNATVPVIIEENPV
jgi:hypothetical protein